MIFNMTSGGSSGLVLNFSVKAYASEFDLPETAKENTIAVITDNVITSWVFDFTEPKVPIDGMVWFVTSDVGDVGFNALKKNNIQMYPMYAKQYISSNWVSVVAKSYQNGEWILLHPWKLYDTGEEFETITGGWVPYAIAGSQYLTAKNPTITKTDTYLHITLSGTAVGGMATHSNSIDLTDFTTLTYTVSNHVITDSNGQINIVISDELYNSVLSQRCYFSGTYTIDISSLNGKYRVGIHLANPSGSTTVSLNSMVLSKEETAASTFDGILFDGGSKNEDITGGWANLSDGATVLKGWATTWSSYGDYFRTNNKVNLSGFNTLNINYTTHQGDNNTIAIDEGTALVGGSDWVAYTKKRGTGTSTLDISNFNGEYYIFVIAGPHGSSTNGTKFEANKVWLE